MNRELWILRHAKAEINTEIDDFDRALKKRGVKAAKRMGLWMKQQHLQPDLVISSPALRAISTTRLICPMLGIAEQDIQQDKRLYLADLYMLKGVLAERAEGYQRVLLVGHNPGLEDLLIELAESIPEFNKLLPTTGLARLRLSVNWQGLYSGCAELVTITHVKALPEID
ncbi:MAG: histidine phosphatase family protein [Methylococcales bacterium]